MGLPMSSSPLCGGTTLMRSRGPTWPLGRGRSSVALAISGGFCWWRGIARVVAGHGRREDAERSADAAGRAVGLRGCGVSQHAALSPLRPGRPPGGKSGGSRVWHHSGSGQPGPTPGSVAFVRLNVHVQVATNPPNATIDFAVTFKVARARVNFR